VEKYKSVSLQKKASESIRTFMARVDDQIQMERPSGYLYSNCVLSAGSVVVIYRRP